MKKNNINKKALSIIEVMVAIFIFTLGISWIYMVISSTVGVNKYNHDYIIASNLARQDIELIRNVRDTNYAKFQKWNKINPYTNNNYNKVFTGSITSLYKIENDISDNYKTKLYTWDYLSSKDFKKALKNKLSATQNIIKNKYKLCLDDKNNYIYCQKEDWTSNPDAKIKTIFYKYIEILPLKTKLSWWNIINNALKIRSKVYWYDKWKVNSTEIPTILTDWKRL